MTQREELIFKFERNKDLIFEFKKDYVAHLDSTNTWDNIAFFDSKITNRQYLTLLDQISTKEYSEEQFQAIKTVFIHDNAVESYIISVDSQYNNLKILYDDLALRRKQLK
jgi:hypothetical protein